MITIDWKERLTKDTQDYLDKKLPKQDYNFEIIFNWYPERVNGKIPAEVIVLITKYMALKINRQHEQYLPFYQFLWEKKGENGKIAFIQFMSRFLPKKPAVYQPVIEKNLLKAEAHDIAAIFEKIYLPLLKKDTEPYMPYFYKWIEAVYEPLNKQAVGFLSRLLKRMPELIAPVLKHLQNRWNYPLAEAVHNHIVILKAVWKIEPDTFMNIFREYKTSRDPQTVEILCGAITDYHAELEPIVENWTHSGNARLKKAATSAHKILLKKKVDAVSQDLSIYITKKGMDSIQNRIAHLMNTERPDVIKAVATAREFGDLSENAEYKAAKERQRAIDHEIDHLRRRSAHLKVVDSDVFPRDAVRFGLLCHTRDANTGEEIWFHLVGVDEINFPEPEGVVAVSIASPIGKGLLGKKHGQIALIQAPMGERQLEILEIK